MKSSYIVSDVYEIDVDTIKYDTAICNFNPPKTEENYQSLLAQIRDNGQTVPAYIRNGLLGDGVHRARACKQLGVRLKVVNIDPMIDDATYILLCNENTFTARNDSATQLAIKGYLLVDKFGYSEAEVKVKLGIKDKRMIGYARAIVASPLNDEFNIIDGLLEGKTVKIVDKHTKSLDVAKRAVAAEEERRERAKEDKTNTVKKLVIDYDELLDTFEAKEDFWVREPFMTGIEMKVRYIELLNAVFGSDEKEVK